MMHHTDTAAWVLNVIKMKKLLSRWAEHTVSSKLSNSMSRSQTMRNFWRNQLMLLRRLGVAGGALVRRTHRALTLLREAEIHSMVSTLLLEWREHAYVDNLTLDDVFEVSDDSNDEDCVPIRPTKKKNKGYNYRCGHCGMKNDHYITTCPKKKAVQERNANFVIATFAAMGIYELD
jgi:hypothetical protein